MKKSKTDATFEELKNTMVDFVERRGDGWKKHNKRTKNLLLSVFIELGELSEKFQWQDIDYLPKDEKERKEIAYELVDVFNYLFMFIEMCGIDFPQAYFEKMTELEKKFPVDMEWGDKCYEVKENYRKSGKNKLYEDEGGKE